MVRNQHAMNGQPLRQTVVINNPPLGFHMRPVTAFAQLAGRFESAVQVVREGRAVNGKSPWDMMSMLSPPGTELTIEVDGPDAAAALEALVGMLVNLAEAEEESAE
jgi:phosphotransferase system HPr (HPr) family protein